MQAGSDDINYSGTDEPGPWRRKGKGKGKDINYRLRILKCRSLAVTDSNLRYNLGRA